MSASASPLGRSCLRAYATERDQFYGSLLPADRSFVVSKTSAIKERMGRTSESIWDTGRDLLDVKAKLGRPGGGRAGKFEEWLRVEFDLSRRTAYRYIAVTEKFNRATVAQFAPSALFLFAQALTPDETIDEALALASTGEKVTAAKAAAMVDRAITGRPGLMRVRGRVKIKPCVKGPFTPSATRYFGSEETEGEAAKSLARIQRYLDLWKRWCAMPMTGDLDPAEVEALRATMEKQRAALSEAARKTCAAMVRD